MTGEAARRWTATVLTLFPEMFPGPLGFSLSGRAREKGLWALETVDIRAFARDKHRSVDDAPAGGGSGMVLRPDVLAASLDATLERDRQAGLERPVIYLSPRGRRIDQSFVRALAEKPGAVLLCGRYEGVDERLLEARPIEEVSLGDFVLSGGEPAALALLDAVVRLLPGVLGDPESLNEESFESGLLEYPHYTRPAIWEGRPVPEVLLSGDHAKVRDWRLEQARRLTRERRPDLWERYVTQSPQGGRQGAKP